MARVMELSGPPWCFRLPEEAAALNRETQVFGSGYMQSAGSGGRGVVPLILNVQDCKAVSTVRAVKRNAAVGAQAACKHASVKQPLQLGG
jgi:hypothetical protein